MIFCGRDQENDFMRRLAQKTCFKTEPVLTYVHRVDHVQMNMFLLLLQMWDYRKDKRDEEEREKVQKAYKCYYCFEQSHVITTVNLFVVLPIDWLVDVKDFRVCILDDSSVDN